MRLPYMKILVWVLTFVGYCYSGYGSSIIKTLRDSVLSAEIIFGDVFKNFITLSKKFKTVHEIFDSAVEENCVFQCPGSKKTLVIHFCEFQFYVLSFRHTSHEEQAAHSVFWRLRFDGNENIKRIPPKYGNGYLLWLTWFVLRHLQQWQGTLWSRLQTMSLQVLWYFWEKHSGWRADKRMQSGS